MKQDQRLVFHKGKEGMSHSSLSQKCKIMKQIGRGTEKELTISPMGLPQLVEEIQKARVDLHNSFPQVYSQFINICVKKAL
ncbi:MAG: hypothetical protein EBW14_20945 [Oxalobacteraceae bacterium]|nr:hypothetical protein [Oxalobacteraceae bacterium]